MKAAVAADDKPAWHNWLAATDGDLAALIVDNRVAPLEVHF